ncbi:MAG TPA: PfkB family carbohydrate kinase, partial [candidate division Zixibacteria bacterium]|nr:PfkB family carbohydrate kinase [candidate division Zixibacteria bacterium]
MPLDLLFGVSRYPAAGEKVDGLSLTIQGGGPVPNTLIGLTRLGCTTSLITAVGKDVLGELSVEEIFRESVDTSHLVFKGNSSAVAAGFVEKGSGRRTLVLDRRVFVAPTDLKLANLPTPRILHLDGRDLEATIKLARWGQKIGAIVSFDIGSIRNDVSPVFPFVDHLVVADSYAYPFTNVADSKAAIKKLAKFGPTSVVITEGTKGQIGFENGEFHRQKAFRVSTADTTGAGDAFH